MKTIIFCFSTLLLFLCINIFGQDPGTLVSIKLMDDGRKVSNNNLKDYTLTLNIVEPFHPVHDNKFNLKDDSAQVHFFEWLPYREQIYELTIVHSPDTMIVRFQMNLDSLFNSGQLGKYKFIWNAFFYLEIPFQTGYFELTDFIQVKSGTYRINDEHEWIAPAPEDRKLNTINK